MLFCLVVFVVQYDQNVVHATNGLGSGIILVPMLGTFLLKVYDRSLGENYSQIILPMLELAKVLQEPHTHSV